MEAVRHWRHYLTSRRFTIHTNQQSIAYIFDKKHCGRIKNDKITRWKIELSCYVFDILYRRGSDNKVADTFSRSYCSVVDGRSLYEIHDALCHPGITRTFAFIRSKYLPFSVEDVRKVVNNCSICLECKPKFHVPLAASLIKAMQPFERLNLDFKGPVPSDSKD